MRPLTLVYFNETTQLCIPEGCNLHYGTVVSLFKIPRIQLVNILDLYSTDNQFESQLGYCLSKPRFSWFSSASLVELWDNTVIAPYIHFSFVHFQFKVVGEYV
jgi:hypothetical protein